MLINGKIDIEFVERYPELEKDSLLTQLEMFKQIINASNLHEAKVVSQNMHLEVRNLFSQVAILMKLLLVCPVSSCECERSLSALRRFKTWLRSTMTQRRLNCVCVCHVHRDTLDELDVDYLAREFASRSEIRRKIYGNFSL